MSSRPFVLQTINVKSNMYLPSACWCGVGIMKVEIQKGQKFGTVRAACLH